MTSTLPTLSSLRKSLGLSALLALTLTVPLSTLAQTAAAWPNKTVKFVNNFPPGGPSDILSREVANVLQITLKQPFIVENKPGAAGNIGADMVAKAPADGYTVLWGIDTTFTVNPHIYKVMPFKPSDLKPLMLISSSGLLVGVNPASGFKTLKDMIQAGKSKSLNFSSAGSGSPGHLAVEVFTDEAGVKINHIPYKGNSPAVLAIVSGEVDGGILATPGMLPHVKAGKITALAVTSRKRSKLAPEVPTVAEAGHKELESEVVYLAMVHASTPEPVMLAMQKAISDAVAKTEVQNRINSLDMEFEGLTGAAAAKRLGDLSNRYSRTIKATGMKVE
ncbi:MAG: tripartite tricarboxylate transporter substrate binding protein [Burkholderiaceae bacterium]